MIYTNYDESNSSKAIPRHKELRSPLQGGRGRGVQRGEGKGTAKPGACDPRKCFQKGRGGK